MDCLEWHYDCSQYLVALFMVIDAEFEFLLTNNIISVGYNINNWRFING